MKRCEYAYDHSLVSYAWLMRDTRGSRLTWEEVDLCLGQVAHACGLSVDSARLQRRRRKSQCTRL